MLNLDVILLPSYNNPGEKGGLYCFKHALDGMIDVVNPQCAEPGCDTRPSYNKPGEKGGIYCSEHGLDGMVDVVSKRCIEPGCDTIPTYNNPGEKGGLYCSEHALDGMVDVKHPRCIEPGCDRLPSYNKRGEKGGLYCNTHKKDGMIDVKNPQCKTPLCETFVSKKYEGYCLYCYVNIFPDKPVSRNYKTKERTIVDYLTKEFPSVGWIADKTISGGCSLRRPDLMVDLGYQVVIIEIDENQHIDYDCSCENKRLMQLSQDVGHRPVIFIRFNPDKYTMSNGKSITSCWGNNKLGLARIKPSKVKEWNERLVALKNMVQYWLSPENISEKTVQVIEFFYDQ